MEQVTTLAALKRHFNAGHGVMMVEYEFNGVPMPDPRLDIKRYPQEVKTNTVTFDDGCYFDLGNAKDWSFMENNGTLAICDKDGIRITYLLVD